MFNLFRRSTPYHCIFCEIVSSTSARSLGESNSTASAEGAASPPPILAETPFVIAIPDKFPAAKHHFLVIPKRHIDNAKCLTADDRGLWEEMMRVGKELVLNEIEDEGER